MGKSYSIEEIKQKTDALGLIFIDKFLKNKHTYVRVSCRFHPEKGGREIELYNLMVKAKTCGCKLQKYTKDDLIKNIPMDIKLLGDYINNSTKIKCHCKICDNLWEATPNKLQQGRGCPHCKSERLSNLFMKTKEQFIKDLEINNPTVELIGDYNGAFKYIKYKCKVCGEISESIVDKVLRKESSCHFCNYSTGEKIIYVVLKKYNINFIPQYSFSDCINIKPLPFDFYLPNYNMCIEFQGEQHYQVVDFSYKFSKESLNKAEEKFKGVQERDKIKKDYCLKNNINFLEICYKDLNKIENILKNKLKL